MKTRIGMIVLVLACLGLLIGLILRNRQADEQKRADTQTILTLSNNWLETSGRLEEQKQVAAVLERDLDDSRQAGARAAKAYTELTNHYTEVSTKLIETEAAMRDEVAKRDSRIADLENQNQNLDKQALDLSSAITSLKVQIDDTQRKLAASEGDKAFLEKELKRLTAEKAELERQFNDLAVLRAQVVKLKEELSIARRVEWIRKGLFANSEQKGAQKLMQGLTPRAAPQPKPSYDLNVEVSADGAVKILPPTNAPAAK